MIQMRLWMPHIISTAAIIVTILLTFANSKLQTEIWRKEKMYSMQLQIFEKRSEILRSLSENLAESSSFAFLLSGATADSDAFTRLVYCIEPTKRAENPTFCKDLSASTDERARYKEFAMKRAQFQTITMLATIYFCRDTKTAISELPSGGFWWNIDEVKKATLLNAMQSEMFCAIKFSDLNLQ